MYKYFAQIDARTVREISGKSARGSVLYGKSYQMDLLAFTFRSKISL